MINRFLGAIAGAENLTKYDSVDADVIQSYTEYSLASLLYYAMKVTRGLCTRKPFSLTPPPPTAGRIFFNFFVPLYVKKILIMHLFCPCRIFKTFFRICLLCVTFFSHFPLSLCSFLTLFFSHVSPQLAARISFLFRRWRGGRRISE
jgi:hypothetical protein